MVLVVEGTENDLRKSPIPHNAACMDAEGEETFDCTEGFSCGPLLWTPLTLVGSVLSAPIVYIVHNRRAQKRCP